jgi:hypothetical protein
MRDLSSQVLQFCFRPRGGKVSPKKLLGQIELKTTENSHKENTDQWKNLPKLEGCNFGPRARLQPSPTPSFSRVAASRGV